MRGLLLLLALTMLPVRTAGADCVDPDATPLLFGFEPLNYKPGWQCGSFGFDAALFSALANQGVNAEIAFDADSTTMPACTLPLLINHKNWHTKYIITDGWDGGFISEHYPTIADAEDCRDEYCDNYDMLDTNNVVVRRNAVDGDAMLWIAPSAISAVLSSTTDAITFCGYCQGGLGRNSWVPAPSDDAGATAVVIDDSTDTVQGCGTLTTLIQGIGCVGHPPPWGPYVEDAAAHFLANTRGTKFEVHGNKKNLMNCSRGCDRGPDVFDVAATRTGVRWLVTEDQPGTHYVVTTSGSWERNAVPETLAVVDGDGSGAYEMAKPVTGYRVDVVAVDEYGRTRQSSRAVVGDEDGSSQGRGQASIPPKGPALAEVGAEAADGRRQRVMRSPASAGARAGAKVVDPPCECADFVVYSSNAVIANVVGLHFCGYTNSQGLYFSIRTVIGDVAGTTMRAALEETRDANRLHNDQCFPPCTRLYADPPTLVIAGDESIVDFADFAEGAEQECQTTCHSYYDYADLDEDGRPDCPVQVVPGATPAEVSLCCESAEDWNEGGDWIVESPKAVVFTSDDGEKGATVPDFATGMMVASEFGGAGYPAEMIAESQVQNAPGARLTRGTAAINAGLRYLFVHGGYTRSWVWTEFMEGPQYDASALTRKQRIVVVAPGCWTLRDPYHLSYLGMHERLMFNDRTKTVAAGVVGQLNSDWDIRNRAAALRISDEFAHAPAERTMSDVLFDAVRSFDTENVRYGRGCVFYGGYVRKRGGDIAGLEICDSVKAAARLRAVGSPSGGSVKVQFFLARESRVVVEVFDVAGRAVGRPVDADLAAGEHEVEWGGGGAGAGVYFARMRVDGKSLTARIVLVR